MPLAIHLVTSSSIRSFRGAFRVSTLNQGGNGRTTGGARDSSFYRMLVVLTGFWKVVEGHFDKIVMERNPTCKRKKKSTPESAWNSDVSIQYKMEYITHNLPFHKCVHNVLMRTDQLDEPARSTNAFNITPLTVIQAKPNINLQSRVMIQGLKDRDFSILNQ